MRLFLLVVALAGCRSDYDSADVGSSSSSSAEDETSSTTSAEPDVPADLGELEPYGPCDETCELCAPWSFENEQAEACSHACGDASQCPELVGGVPVCWGGRCYLSCAAIVCPEGWRCVGSWCAP